MAGLENGFYIALGMVECEGNDVLGVALWLADAMKICEDTPQDPTISYCIHSVQRWELGAKKPTAAWSRMGPGDGWKQDPEWSL